MRAHYRSCLIFFVLLLFAVFPLRAQQAYLFEALEGRTPLVQSPVTSILQDKKGFVWLGTWSGLARYDGVAFNLFQQLENPISGQSSGKILCLYQTSDGRLWAGTRFGGLFAYDALQDRFIPAAQMLGSSNQAVSLYQQMRQAIAYDILSRLASKDITMMLSAAP